MTSILTIAANLAPRCVDIRRAIHRHPERGFAELETTALLAAELEQAGIAHQVRSDGVGLTAVVGSGGPIIAWRADLDGLPIQEMTGLPFTSEVPGWMHACGHDVHAAIAVGTARALQELAPKDLTVRFIFQPAEETFPGGARQMAAEGVLTGVRAIAAFHVDPSLDVGKVGLRVGPITSSSDRFRIVVSGPGGHTARPHETVDTLHAAGLILSHLPTLVHRSIDGRIPLALVFGQIHGGDADNVIPARVAISGTVRMLDESARLALPELIDRLAKEIAQPTGAKVITNYEDGIPPVINHPGVIEAARTAVVGTFGHEAVAGATASMGAEDFSDYLRHVPGALLRLGSRDPNRPEVALHSAIFDIDERAIGRGIAVATATLIELGRQAS